MIEIISNHIVIIYTSLIILSIVNIVLLKELLSLVSDYGLIKAIITFSANVLPIALLSYMLGLLH